MRDRASRGRGGAEAIAAAVGGEPARAARVAGTDGGPACSRAKGVAAPARGGAAAGDRSHSARAPKLSSPHVGSVSPRTGLLDVAVALGFACLVATMVIYSAAAMPFQRFATLPDFVEVFGYGLRAAAPAGAVAAILPVFGMGRVLGSVPIRVAGAAAYTLGNAGLCRMALVGAGSTPMQLAVGICIGVGCALECLAWARVMARYDLRRATGVVAAAAVVAALLGWAQLLVPEGVAAPVFMAATVTCVAMPFALSRSVGATGCDAVGDASSAAGSRPSVSALAARLRALLDVALVPAVGLALFAMLMAVRGELFFEDYRQYVIVQVVVAALLLACALVPARVPLLRGVYRGLIPTLAAVVLAANYISEALFGGSTLEVSLVMVLYTAAALLTLSTLAGMAHAAEFSGDLIAGLAVGLFCLVTVLVQNVFAVGAAGEAEIRGFIVVSSGLYAAGMIVLSVWRGLRAERDAALEALAGTDADPSAADGADVGRQADTRLAPMADPIARALAPSLDERCDEVARSFSLTAREREILGYLARGHTGVYIADELLISPNTARTHIHNIYRKLGVTGREDVLRLVRR